MQTTLTRNAEQLAVGQHNAISLTTHKGYLPRSRNKEIAKAY